jgi:nucleoside-diphosphate-sugar epimerase
MILVTGASGLVGSHLVKELINKGETVKAIYRSQIPSFQFSHKINWVKADILDELSLEDVFENVTKVYHCAGAVSFNPKKKQELYTTNIEGTANVVNACINCNIEKLLFVSSVAALGRIREHEMIHEKMNWTEETSNSEYGKTKYFAEMEVWRGIGEGLNAVIVNPTIILGAGDWEKGSTEIFKSAYDEFPWFTEGISGFVDVNDVVNAMIALMNSEITNERFILSGGNFSYKELFTTIANNFNKKPPNKKVTPFIAALVWRLEAIKGKLTGKEPLLTKETAHTAQAKVYFNNKKLLESIKGFNYTSLQDSVKRICNELKIKYNL